MACQSVGLERFRELLFSFDVTANKLNYQRFTLTQPVTGIRVEAISPSTAEGTDTPICEVEIKFRGKTVYLETIYRDLLIDNGFKRCGFCPANLNPQCGEVIEVYTRTLLASFSNYEVKVYLHP